MELLIEYIDSQGNVSSRRITDIRPLGNDAIEARCLISDENRTFKLLNITQAIDPSTGEVVDNLWEYFGIAKEENGNPKIIALVAPILPAIRALKYFCLQVRMKHGFAKRERQHIIDFVLRHITIPDALHQALDEWLVKIWCGNMYENRDPLYIYSLLKIPEHLLYDCRQTAFAIARGSGRREINKEIINRIDTEFPGA